jgi:5-methylcytosine-specific restriction endonuclease McrA
MVSGGRKTRRRGCEPLRRYRTGRRCAYTRFWMRGTDRPKASAASEYVMPPRMLNASASAARASCSRGPWQVGQRSTTPIVADRARRRQGPSLITNLPPRASPRELRLRPDPHVARVGAAPLTPDRRTQIMTKTSEQRIPFARGMNLPVCLTSGTHTPGSEWERECPLRPGGKYDQRRAAGRASAEARLRRRNGASEGVSVAEVPADNRAPTNEAPAELPDAAARRGCRRHRPVWRLMCSDCNSQAPKDSGGLPEDWRRVRSRVLRRDGRRCKHCGTRDRLSVHHVTPRPLGSHDPKNLVTLCETCHDAVENPAELGTV